MPEQNKPKQEWEDELKKLLDDPRTGLKQSSDTNKTYNSILALFTQQRNSLIDEAIEKMPDGHWLKRADTQEEIKEVLGYNACRNEVIDILNGMRK